MSRAITWPEVAVVAIIVLGSCVVFFGALRLIRALWALVFEAFSNSSTPKAKILRDLVGGITVGGRIKMVGVGLLGTLLILWFAVQAIGLLDFKF